MHIFLICKGICLQIIMVMTLIFAYINSIIMPAKYKNISCVPNRDYREPDRG